MRDALTRFVGPTLVLLLLLVLSGCMDTSTSRQVGREQFMQVARPSIGTVVNTSASQIRNGYVYVELWEMKVPTRHSRTTTYYIPISELTSADLRELELRNQSIGQGSDTGATSRPSDALPLRS